MNTSLAWSVLSACVLGLVACDKTPSSPPMPTVSQPVATPSGATPGSVAESSVPLAASVFPSANAPKSEETASRSNSTMSATQESTAMPMPGQNNDHSAPLGPAKHASAP
jgi:hypothetical protein